MTALDAYMTFTRILCVAAALVLLSGCASLPIAQPEVRSVQCRTTAIDFEGVNLAFDVDVFNPSMAAVPGPLARYAIYVEETPLPELEKPRGIDLDPQGVSILSLPARVSYNDVWAREKALRGAAEVNYTLRGALVFEASGSPFAVPITHSGSFPVLRRPEMTAVKVRLSDVSLNEALLIVDAEIVNPNSFALGTEQLEYSLDMGDVRVGKLKSWTKGSVPAHQRKPVALSGKISPSDGLIELLMKGVSGTPRIVAEGFIQTPYGAVKLERDEAGTGR